MNKQEAAEITEGIWQRISSRFSELFGFLAGLERKVTAILTETKRVRKLSVANVTLTTADKEYEWQLPLGCKRFTLHIRDGSEVRFATNPGKVEGSINPYFTLKPNTAYTERDLGIDDFNMTFYFASAIAGKVVEIIVGV